MKKKLCIACVILTMLTACVFSSCRDKNKGNESNDTNTQNAAAFIEVDQAKEKLESAIWGSQGWSIYYQNQSPYIYAVSGEYMLRYNVSENEIDRAIEYKDGFIDSSFNFTVDGRFAVLTKIWSEKQQYEPRNIYLLNFEKSEVVYLADSKDNFKMEMIPEDIRSDFNIESIFKDSYDGNLEILKYNIEYDSKDNRYIAYVRDNNLLLHEVTALKEMIFNGEQSFVGIDSKTIGTLVPTNGESTYLGYYKFVLIDVEQNKILQECPINIK